MREIGLSEQSSQHQANEEVAMNCVCRTKWWLVLGLMAVLLVAGFKAGRFVARQPAEPRAMASRGDIVQSVYGIGTVMANRTYRLKPGMAGTLTDVLVREGDKVQKGDRLLVLDNRSTVLAPFDGTVTELPFKPGENVFPQTVVVEVTDLSDRYLTVSLEQRGALKVRQGMKARLSFDGLREQVFEGTVESAYSNGSDLRLRIASPDLPDHILPGMTADVAVIIAEQKNIALVPALTPAAAAVDGKGKP